MSRQQAKIVNTIMERIAPWHRVEWIRMDSPASWDCGPILTIAGVGCCAYGGTGDNARVFVKCLDGQPIEHRQFIERIDLLLGGYVRNDAGEFVPPQATPEPTTEQSSAVPTCKESLKVAPLTECVAQRDGDCDHAACPQLKDWKPHCPLDKAETTPEVEYRDADSRHVGLNVSCRGDGYIYFVTRPLLAVLPDRFRDRFIVQFPDSNRFTAVHETRVPADPMRDAPKDRKIEVYAENRWQQSQWSMVAKRWRNLSEIGCPQLDPVAWREVQK